MASMTKEERKAVEHERDEIRAKLASLREIASGPTPGIRAVVSTPEGALRERLAEVEALLAQRRG